MKIIFAQGNPGATYAHTRHNVGFIMIDRLARVWGASFSSKTKFKADIAEVVVESEKLLLVKPTTFYNETGSVVRALIDFYKINPATELLVLHDELALPLGVVKTRFSGSNAGNNGIKSLNTHLGQQYARIRIGIYTPHRDHMEDADFVLNRFSNDEYAMLEKIFPTVEKFVQAFLRDSLEATKVAH
jgi:PTH1 family peptidyl-tRNA hydrolase